MEIRNSVDQAKTDRPSADRAAVERAAGERNQPLKTVVLQPQPKVAAGGDHATISASGRDTLAAVEGLAERARHQGSERREIVAAARARLESGQLQSPDVLDATARAIVDGDYLAR